MKLIISNEDVASIIEMLNDPEYIEEHADYIESPESDFTVTGAIVNGELQITIGRM